MGQRPDAGPSPGPPDPEPGPLVGPEDPASPTARRQGVTGPRQESQASAAGPRSPDDESTGQMLGPDPADHQDSTNRTKMDAEDTDQVAQQAASVGTVSWGDKVRAHVPQQARITEERARSSHMLAGVWNPAHAKQLVATLTADWETISKSTMTAEERSMRQEALAPATASCDESVRAWTQREDAIIMAYLNGQLELPHPPNFLKEVLIGEHRALMEDMHEAYFNASLTAVIPATVRLSKNVAHATLIREIYNANTDKNTGQSMMRAL
ncbi:hypothetical protein PF008_g18623 [Phytophthora fragariae]|uniref:Uncharacterized protein n=1 Tax=Phytophthora fragariae TaxID=53985 RepID=A0A6G0R4S9_9STRA|nr:hypothetical protein PF008_g18623 [Phytophthora fragariae]